MGGFNPAWFTALAIGFFFMAADYLIPKAKRRKVGRWLLAFGAGFFVLGVIGLGRDAYIKLRAKPNPPLASQSNTPSIPAQPQQAPAEEKRAPKNTKSAKQSARVPLQQTINAPNGIAIGGGTVSNPTVNNFVAAEWHFSDTQRSKWSEFVSTLPPECANILVVSDIPDKNSQDFASEMFDILNAQHKVNRLGHLMLGKFGEGVGVQVHDENDSSVPTARLIVSGMHDAGIPVVEFSSDPKINNHEIHIVVCYKPSK